MSQKAQENIHCIRNNVMFNVTYIYYIDESYSFDKRMWIYSAIGIPSMQWRTVFDRIKLMRKTMKQEFKIPLYKELHATKFVNGHGDYGPMATKPVRADIFARILRYIASMQLLGIHVISSRNCEKYRCLERLLNRIECTMKNNSCKAILFFDAGNEIDTKKMVRKMCVINGIPSKYGGWGNGDLCKNIPLDSVVCDAQFADSEKDYFIQIADLIAYSLLCKYVPSKCVGRYALENAYDFLEPILLKQACRKNPLGIVE